MENCNTRKKCIFPHARGTSARTRPLSDPLGGVCPLYYLNVNYRVINFFEFSTRRHDASAATTRRTNEIIVTKFIRKIQARRFVRSCEQRPVARAEREREKEAVSACNLKSSRKLTRVRCKIRRGSDKGRKHEPFRCARHQAPCIKSLSCSVVSASTAKVTELCHQGSHRAHTRARVHVSRH